MNVKDKTELLAAVDQLAPLVETHFLDLDKERTLPRPLVDALAESGLLLMSGPAYIGGSELDMVDQFEVYKAVGNLDASLCWVMATTGTSICWPAPFLADEAYDTIYKNRVIPHAATSVLPSGQAAAVPGGYQLSGTWGFASGLFHADWVLAGGLLNEGDKQRRMYFLLPISDVTVIDNWHAAGLRGSGSGSFKIEDKFVPDAFAWFFDAPMKRTSTLHKLGLMGFVINEHPGLSLGVARRALDEVRSIAVQSKSRFRGKSLADREVFQRDLALYDIRWEAADALMVKGLREMMQIVQDGNSPSDSVLAKMRAIGTFVSKQAIEMVEFAFRYAGGRAIMEDHILQRCLRDIQAVSLHFLTSEVSFENHGKYLLDHPEADLRG